MKLSRREFLVAAAALPLLGSGPPQPPPIITTSYGPVRGFFNYGMLGFKGIPYGAADRFAPPRAPTPWTDVRDASAWGTRCPQPVEAPSAISRIFDPEDTGAYDEQCLALNVWTPSYTGKRPVMVWFHAGGFGGGSTNRVLSDGTNLAMRGDVVVVTVNHRLNVFGYLYVDEIFGLKGAGNAGMLDLVRALEWVRDNAASFGGDPGNVTIFGPSGGASKVATLMAMPKAKGLFHKAIIESGQAVRVVPKDHATALARAVIDDVSAKSAADLRRVPVDRLLSAMQAAGKKTAPAPGKFRSGFGPVVDGDSLPEHPFHPSAPALSSHVPLIVGGAHDETALFHLEATVTRADLETRVQKLVGNDSKRVLEAYKGHEPKDAWIAITTDRGLWHDAITVAERRATAKAPTYMYDFRWRRDAQLKAFHGLHVPFVFETIDAQPNMTARDQRAKTLATIMRTAWTTFAKTGAPGWPAYDTKTRATQVFDDQCRVENDPRPALRALWSSVG